MIGAPSAAESMRAGKRDRHVAAIIFLILALSSGALAWGLNAPSSTFQIGPTPVSTPLSVLVSAPSGTYFDHVLIIMMENHAICSILTWCGGAGPYETSLAQTYGLAKQYVKCTTPSLPNYLCTSGASTFGCTGYDGAPHSNTCTNVAWGSKNIFDTFAAASLTFKAYMESMPTNCSTSTSGEYAVKHDGFVYYSDNVLNATRCNLIVPAGTGDSTLLKDLNSTSASANYMWLTPNLCNDMHDCSVATGDNYLKGLVPQILNSPVFKNTRAALFITFDEDSGTSGAPNIYTVWAGPVAKLNYTSTVKYNHYSLLSTIESNWNLPPLTANDSNAPNMDEFFASTNPGAPTARFSFTPSWPQVNATVSFNGSASTDPDPTATLQYRWDWTNDGTWDTGWSSSALATHAYISPGTYTARMEVEDSHGLTANATRQVVADSEPPTTTSTLSGTAGSNGWYRSSVSVTLSAHDDLSGVAVTKYRKDGGTWTTYASAVSVSGEGSHSVDYYSVDNAGNTESTHTISLKIDTVAPSTSATLQGNLVNNSYYVGPVNVTLSASDATSGVAWSKYRVDSGSWTTYASPVMVSGNGTHLFGYYSQDNAGNTESTHTATISIGSAPTTPISFASLAGTVGNASWYISSVSVTLSAIDPYGSLTSINYSLDNAAWKSYSAPFSVSDGRHTLRYNATDALGHREPTNTQSFNIDTHAPTTTATLQGTLVNNTYYNGAVNLTLSATDSQSGVAGTQYMVDAGTWSSYAGPILVAGNGTHLVSFNSTDVAGNHEATKTKQFVIGYSGSAAPPTTTVHVSGNPGFAGWYVSNVTLTLNATDPAGAAITIRDRVDNGTWQAYSTPLVLPDGRHSIDYEASDSLGHSESMKAISVDVDTTPPSLLVLAPSGTVTASTTTISWAASDSLSGLASVQVSVDGGPFQTQGAGTNVSVSLPDGSHYLTVKAADAAGNLVVKTDTFTVDTNPFSPNGPMMGAPLYAVIGLTPIVLGVAVLLAVRRRGRRRRGLSKVKRP